MSSKLGFDANTKILMNNHTVKNIQDIKVGDVILNHLYNECVIETTIIHENCDELYEVVYANNISYTMTAKQKIALIYEHKIVHIIAQEFFNLPNHIQSIYKGIYKTIAGYQPIAITITKKENNTNCYEIKAKSSTYALYGDTHTMLCI